MTSRRALIREADLRRMARVAREEGVAFKGMIGPEGGFSFSLTPCAPDQMADRADDLDARLAEYGAR